MTALEQRLTEAVCLAIARATRFFGGGVGEGK
jgi:hypothetical protein